MYHSFRVAAIALTALVVGCTSTPTSTQTNNNQNNNQNNNATEVKKTISGKITRNGMANPKVMLVTTHGDTIAEAATAFMSLPGSSDSDRYPGFTAVKPGSDNTYSTELKLGSKAYTYGMLVCWNDANDDGKFSNDEVAGSALAYNNQAKVDFVLSKTEYKEYVADQQVDVKAAYDWAFQEIKQSLVLKMANRPANGKFAFLTVEGATDAELRTALDALSVTTDGVLAPSATVIAPAGVGDTHTLEIKLGDKPYKAVSVLGWNDANSDGKVQADELSADPKATVVGSEAAITFRLSSTTPNDIKVLTSDNVTDAVSEYTWTFTNDNK
ncbi:hypothetical protein J7643_08965 [bacterium]|nr:hypothetical protein [bacterium]